MSFFSLFPVILNPDGKLLTDITVRTKIRDSWLDNERLYYIYNYQDHDRPEDIAHKMYGDQGLGWIIVYSNNILDPNFDFPLSTSQFESYLNDKYRSQGESVGKTGVEYALSTVDPVYGYQKEVSYGYEYNTVVEYFPVDQTSYENIVPIFTTVNDPVTNKPIQYSVNKRYPLVTIYDIEFQNNEKKRPIKILKQQYVNQAKTELRNLLKQ
jgi:hypothetical protein